MGTSQYFTPGGFSNRKSVSPFDPIKSPTFTAPTRPEGVPIRAGAAANESTLLARANTISSKYQGARSSAIAQARAGLKGYGGFSVDDQGRVSRDPNAAPGTKEATALQADQAAMSAQGIGDSSFAVKRMGSTIARLGVEAAGVVTQHAATMNQLVQQEADEYDAINTNLLQLYGDEAQYAIDNPPPPPPPPPAPEGLTGTNPEGTEMTTAPTRRLLPLPNSQNWSETQRKQWLARHPGWEMRRRGNGSYVAVKEGG